MRELSAADVALVLRTPDRDDNKFRRGVVALATGSVTYPGAGVLTVAGASRMGAGMIRYLGAATQPVLARFPETVFAVGPADAAVVGSGWDDGLALAATEALCGGGPSVIDAGALDRTDLWLSQAGGPRVLTPHYGEAARLWKQLEPKLAGDASAIDEDPFRAARRLAELTDSVVVLKGADTLVVDPQGRGYAFRGVTGWAGVAGSGDVLAGMIGSLLAQRSADARFRGAPCDVALVSAAAVWIHGHAAAIAAGCAAAGGVFTGGHPITAQEIAQAIPSLWQRVT